MRYRLALGHGTEPVPSMFSETAFRACGYASGRLVTAFRGAEPAMADSSLLSMG